MVARNESYGGLGTRSVYFAATLYMYSAIHEQVKRYTRVTRELLAREVASPRVQALLALASTHTLLKHSCYASACDCTRVYVVVL